MRKRKQPATPEEMELAAKECGLWERVQEVGWDGLSAAEAGRLGAWVQRLRRPPEDDEPFLPDAIDAL